MRSVSLDWDRWSRLSGVAFVVVAIVAFVIIGEPPKVDGSLDELVSFYDGDRGRVMTGMAVFGLASVLLGWFVGTVANLLRGAGEGRLAGTSIALASAFIGAQLILSGITGALSLNIAAAGDAGVIGALHTTQWTIDTMSAFPMAGLLLALAVGLTRSGILPSWTFPAGAAAAVIALLRGTNWAEDGFWAPGGGWTVVTIIAILLWFLMISVMLFRAAGTMRETVPSASPAT